MLVIPRTVGQSIRIGESIIIRVQSIEVDKVILKLNYQHDLNADGKNAEEGRALVSPRKKESQGATLRNAFDSHFT